MLVSSLSLLMVSISSAGRDNLDNLTCFIAFPMIFISSGVNERFLVGLFLFCVHISSNNDEKQNLEYV